MKKLQLQLPYLSKAEIEMKQTLLNYQEKLKTFEASLDHIKKKSKLQSEKLKEIVNNSSEITSNDDDYKKISFNETQLKHVKELLSQE